MAAHESPRTTKLYDRRQAEITLDEVERIAIWRARPTLSMEIYSIVSKCNTHRVGNPPRVGVMLFLPCGNYGEAPRPGFLMPARSTPFQKLVLHLQEQLASSATVTESAALLSRITGKQREVDVVVRLTVGDRPVVISFECIEHKRSASVEWVEQMKSKHDQLETDYLVLVSLSGFSEQAEAFARACQIETYKPEDACALDWNQIVGQFCVRLALHDYVPLATTLRVEAGGELQTVEAGPDTEIFRPDANAKGKLRDLVFHVLRSPAFGSAAMDRQNSDGPGTITFDFSLEHENYFVDESGRFHLIKNIHVTVRAVRRSAEIPITSLSWRDAPAAFGKAQTPLGPTIVTVVEAEPGQSSIKVAVPGHELRAYGKEWGAAAGVALGPSAVSSGCQMEIDEGTHEIRRLNSGTKSS